MWSWTHDSTFKLYNLSIYLFEEMWASSQKEEVEEEKHFSSVENLIHSFIDDKLLFVN